MTTIASSESQSDAHPSIHLLPPEILGTIFGLTVTACKQECKQTRNLNRSSYATWYNFTFVSRHWRSVALTTPYIWGTLLFLSRKLVSVMLERSKLADLSIDSLLCHRNVNDMSPLIEQVINDHTSRIVEITLDIWSLPFSTWMDKLKQRPPSLRLRELRLRLTGPPTQISTKILVPDRLQVLEAEGFNIAWQPSQLFPCLIDLTIRSNLTIRSTSLTVSLPEFITALRGMPALEVLRMRHSLPSGPSVPPVQPVHLARLRTLDIISTQDSSDISNFLSLITVPAATNIQIQCVTYMGRGPRLLAFTSSVHSLLQGMHLKDCCQSVWVCRWGNGLKIIAPAETRDCISEIELNIRIGYTPEETLRRILPALLRDEILSLRLEIGLRSKVLFELSDTLPRLRNVVLASDSMPNFIAVMQLLRFQNLRSLTLYGARFSPKINGGLEVGELRNCLKLRNNMLMFAKLDILKIISCYGIYENDIQRLREIVDVEWDGIVYKQPPSHNTLPDIKVNAA